jgi:hypothetical protein
MLIYTIKLKGEDYQLKNPIEIEEEESWLGGKHMHVLKSKEFGILSYHNSLEISRECMRESLNLIIGSHLFEDYSDHEYRRALQFQNMIRWHVYG